VDLKYDWTLGRYQVSLPWKTDFCPQRNDYEIYTVRLNQLRRLSYARMSLSFKTMMQLLRPSFKMVSLNEFKIYRIKVAVIFNHIMVF